MTSVRAVEKDFLFRYNGEMKAIERTNGQGASVGAFCRLSLRGWLFLVLPTGILSAVFCRYWIDLPVARWCWMRHYEAFGIKYPKFVHKILTLMEVFGDYLGIVLVALLIFELDRHHRGRLLRFLTAILFSGLTVNVIKFFVIRRRPQGFRFFDPDLVAQHDVLLIDWTPWMSAVKSIENSFPSGHTATAFTTFVVLSFFYPEGRRLFFALAILVGVQRIMVCAHFPSDVIVGAMIGSFIGGAFTSLGRLPKVFDCWETYDK